MAATQRLAQAEAAGKELEAAREMTTLRIYLPRVERTPEGYRKWLGATVGPAADRIGSLYPAGTDDDVEGAVIDLSTDLFFTCPTRLAVRSVSKAGAPAYLYRFTRVRPGGQSLGAYHAAEINYVFGTEEPWLPGDATDHTIADAMQRYWVAFATGGRPAAKGLPEWPAYTCQSTSETPQVSTSQSPHLVRSLRWF